jgi:hypothetical protein
MLSTVVTLRRLKQKASLIMMRDAWEMVGAPIRWAPA